MSSSASASSPSESTTDASPPTLGRPRDEDRTEAILESAVELMHEVGWNGFKVQEVARRAGAGQATIYRRWETKQALVAAGMYHDLDISDLQSREGSPREQLVRFMTQFGDRMCGSGGAIITVLAAARDHEVMRDALHEVIDVRLRSYVCQLVGELLGNGHPLTPTVTDAILGTLLFRGGMLEIDTPGEDFADEMLALIDSVNG